MGTKKRGYNDRDYFEYASKHLRYEIEMLTFTTSELRRITSKQGNKGLHNAVLESFIVHARNLIDFLFPCSQEQPNKHDDDLTIRDYLRQEYLGKSLSRPQVLRDARYLANKTIAHLTIERRTKFQTPKDRNIRFNEIFSNIQMGFIDLLSFTNPQRFPKEMIEIFNSINRVDTTDNNSDTYTSTDFFSFSPGIEPPKIHDDDIS